MDITTKEQWDALEKPLAEIDDELLRIAEDRNLTVDKNYHNWPSRSLSWRTGDGLDRKLEISVGENGKFFQIYGYAWYDDANGQRFIKILNLKKGIQFPLTKAINDIVSPNIDLIDKIKKEELNKAVYIDKK